MNSSSGQSKKGSALPYELYRLFQEYIYGGCKTIPDSNLLETMVEGPVNNSAKRKRLRKKFKSWAARLSIRPTDGRLVYKSTGKLIVPEEYFISTIETKHFANGDRHLNLTQTIDAVMSEYSVGKREFGIDRDLIVAVVNHCQHPDCQRASIQRHQHRNSAQEIKIPPLKSIPESNKGNSGVRGSNDHRPVNELRRNREAERPSSSSTKKRPNPYPPRPPSGWTHFKISNNRISPSRPGDHGRRRYALIKPKPTVQEVPDETVRLTGSIEIRPTSQMTHHGGKVDDLYSLLLKRIHLMRRVLRPSLATGCVRLHDSLRNYIGDSLGLIQRLRQEVPADSSKR